MERSEQMFSQMDQVALGRLAGRDPQTIARNAGIPFDPVSRVFHLPSLGMELTVEYPSYRILPAVSGWHRLLILHYLDLADGVSLTGRDISFSQMKDGLVRGSGIDRKCEGAFQQMRELDPVRLAALCTEMGGERLKTNADVSFRISFLPRFPVTLKVWLPDEEFPASGRMFVDASADHYFTIEDAVTVAELLIERLTVPEGKRTFSV